MRGCARLTPAGGLVSVLWQKLCLHPCPPQLYIYTV